MLNPVCQSLLGRVAIVTGAATGARASLGATFATTLARHGAHVVAVDLLDLSGTLRAIELVGGRALALEADLADPAAAAEIVARSVAAFGRIDILVNNAALGSNSPPVGMADMTAEAWDRLMDVNVRGLFLATQAVAPVMAAGGYGKIVNLGSPMVQGGAPRRIHYVTAKAAVHGMTRALARELGPQGIRVNTLTPGYPLTPFNRAAMDASPGMEARLLADRCVPDHITPDDIAGVLSFLVSPQSDAITGQHIVVDNGGTFI